MRILFFVILTCLYSCKKENIAEQEKKNRIIVKSIDNGNFKATFFQISTISDVTNYVAIEKNKKEDIIFHGNFGSVIDIYFRGEDTLYLKCYKPSSNIIYEYKKEMNGLKILQDTLVTEKEYNEKTHN
ncbi:hypothetical protein LF887_18110 [Chryseobacterium sp. MEBOG06]|uniref:hypothetical protein n=1 Tax=Chryseobacterium sp. MEBOG06 TaxID=2879938 RepID=UPI001F3A8F91|nr:hypothetical protein [Chryseobacterium sp. MEBOG06]UKB82910.1 hypothetical protein LF887_18110 [Chryseobacterium sp. MEBOG06]